MVEYNTIIIGFGIAGMSACIYLRRAGIRTLVIEGDVVGGQLNKIDVVENYPGFVEISGSDLMMNIFNQVSSYDTDYLYESVNRVDLDKRVVFTDSGKYRYKYLVIATGRRNRLLGIDLEESLIGRGISFCASCDGNLYRGKDVVVVGGANSAISEALYLSSICRKVYLVYRKGELRGEDILCRRLEDKENVSVIYNSNVIKYNTRGDVVSGVELDSGDVIDCDCVFLTIGYIPNGELFDVNKKNGYILVDSNCMTSVNGVYACGDIVYKSVYQLVTASCDGVNAASSIIEDNISRKD